MVTPGEESGRRRGRRPAPEFAFHRVNHTALWAKLDLTATQLSRLTGISRRQVEWWRRRGYLPPSPNSPDRFNGDAVTLAMLIRQATAGGLTLARAHEAAVRHLARTLSSGVARAGVAQPGETPDESALIDLEQKLLAAYNTLGLVLKSIAPLAQHVEQEFNLEDPPNKTEVSGTTA